MKAKLKILVLVFVLAMLVSAMAIVISADDAPDYKVGNTTYETWAEAVAAAGGTEIIYLNDDIDVTAEGIKINSDVRLDLNGHSITMPDITATSNDGYSLFYINKSGVSFELLGEGTLNKAGRFIAMAEGATDCKVEINAYGDGIVYERSGPSDNNGTSRVFIISKGSEFTVTGKLKINARTPALYIFELLEGESLANPTSVKIENATISLDPLWLNNNRYHTSGQSTLMILTKYNNVEINSSYIDVVDGNGFYSNNNFKDSLDKTTDTGSFVQHTTFIEANNSTILTRTGGKRLTFNTSMGILFSLGTAPVEVRMTDCTIMGASRTTVTTATKSSNQISNQYFYFNNVNYEGDPDVLYGSPAFSYANVNVDWNGGTIHVTKNTGGANIVGAIFLEQYKAAYDAYYLQEKFIGTDDYGKKFTGTDLTSVRTEDALFGEIAKLAAQTEANVYIKSGFTVNTASGAVKLTASASSAEADKRSTKDILFTIDDNWINNPEYLCSYESYYNVIIFAKNGVTSGDFFSNGCTFPYTEIMDSSDNVLKWYGVRLRNLTLDGMTLPATTQAVRVGTTQDNAWVLKDGVWKKYRTILTDEAYVAPTDKVVDIVEGVVPGRTTVFNPTSSYVIAAKDGGSTITGSLQKWEQYSIDLIGAGNAKRFGTISYIAQGKDQNGYVKYEVAADAVAYNNENSYFEIKATGYGSARTDSDKNVGAYGVITNAAASNPIADYKYVVQEFDLWTDTGKYLLSGANYLNRFIRPYYNTKDKIFTTETKQNQVSNIFNIYEDGRFYIIDEANVGHTYKLPLDGSSTRITMIIDFVLEKVSYKLQISETETVDRVGYNASKSRVHFYINGEYFATSARIAGSTIIDEAVLDTWGLDALRITAENKNLASLKGGSICCDNFYLAYYTESSEMSSVIRNAIVNKNVNEGECFNYHPFNDRGYIVDGVRYKYESDAIAALKPGSTLELEADLKNSFVAPENVKIITNGHSVAPIASATNQRAFTYDGTIYMLSAKGSQLINVNFVSEEAGINETASFGTGTIIKSPVDLDKLSAVSVGGETTYLLDWTLVDGEDVKLVDGSKTVAYPVYGVANVTWVDADGNQLKKEVYRPGATPTLPEGLVYETDLYYDHGWYDLKVTGWTKALSTKLSYGENVLSPDVTPVKSTHSTIENIKLGLTLYSYYELNIYLPVYSRDARITNVKITEGGANVARRYVCNSAGVATGEAWTIGGLEYEKYYVSIGVAETANRTYTVSYMVNGVEFTQNIVYSVPYYASQVMSDNEQSDSAKTLVVNMANYALATLDLMGAQADANVAIYEYIVETYKDTYLGTYNALLDERFAAEDNAGTAGVSNDIYRSSIANLTYNDSSIDYTKYIESVSFRFSTFEPSFAIKYSDAAKAFSTMGVKKPNSQNAINYHDTGVWFYVQYGNGKNTYCYQYAFDKSGNRVLYNDVAAWGNGGVSADHDYYAFTENPLKGENISNTCRSLKDITKTISISILTCSQLDSNGKATATNGGDYVCVGVSYNLAAYIAAMIDGVENTSAAIAEATDAASIEELEIKLAEYEKALTASKALYAYSLVANEYAK